MSNILDLRQIMDAEDVTEKTIDVPEWGGSVVVKSLSHRAMREIKKSVESKHDLSNEEDIPEDELEKWIFIKGMIQPSINEEEYELLMDKSFSAVQKVLMGIMGTTKLGDKAVKESERTFPDGPVGVRAVSDSRTVGDDSRAVADGITASS